MKRQEEPKHDHARPPVPIGWKKRVQTELNGESTSFIHTNVCMIQSLRPTRLAQQKSYSTRLKPRSRYWVWSTMTRVFFFRLDGYNLPRAFYILRIFFFCQTNVLVPSTLALHLRRLDDELRQIGLHCVVSQSVTKEFCLSVSRTNQPGLWAYWWCRWVERTVWCEDRTHISRDVLFSFTCVAAVNPFFLYTPVLLIFNRCVYLRVQPHVWYEWELKSMKDDGIRGRRDEQNENQLDYVDMLLFSR